MREVIRNSQRKNMALVMFGGMVTQASGKIGSQVFSRNKGGAYARNKGIDTFTGTPSQLVYNAFLGSIISHWQNNTYPDRQTAWNNAAASMKRINRVGNVVGISGYNLFVSVNMNRLMSGLAITDSYTGLEQVATVWNSFFEPSLSAASVLVTYNTINGSGNDFLIIRATQGLSTGITFVNNYLRIITKVFDTGGGTIDITTEYNSVFTTPLVAGQRVWLDCQCINSNTGQRGGSFKSYQISG